MRGIEARAWRLVIGNDARKGALIQRMRPAGYWRAIARLSAGLRNGQPSRPSPRLMTGNGFAGSSGGLECDAFRRLCEAPSFPDPKGVTYEAGTSAGAGEWVRPKA